MASPDLRVFFQKHEMFKRLDYQFLLLRLAFGHQQHQDHDNGALIDRFTGWPTDAD